jgi:hypothetical protein
VPTSFEKKPEEKGAALEESRTEAGGDQEEASVAPCDNPPRKIPYYRLKPIHFGH